MSSAKKEGNLWFTAVVAITLGIIIAAVGIFPWTILAQLNARLSPELPWCVPVGILWLALLWMYLNGKGWPHSNSHERRELLRARPLSETTKIWSVITAAIAFVTIVAMYLLAIQFVDLPVDAFRPRAVESLSLSVFIVVMIMTAIVAGVAEEAAYRGYMQGMLERRLNVSPAIALTTVAFTAVHLLGGMKTLPLVIPVAAASVVFGALTALTRSILPAVVLHILIDATTLPLEWRLVSYFPMGRFQTSGMDTSFIGIALLVVVCSMATTVAFMKLRRSVRPSQLGSSA